MRHGKKVNHLGRQRGHRKAMLANMACSLIERKRINTTLAKAKALRLYVEPLLTNSKEDSTHSRRIVFSYLKDKEAVSELFRDVAPKIADRPGGYTRILKTGNRLGDNAEMCFIELVDFNETYVSDKKEKKTSRRSRRGGSGSGAKVAKPKDVVVAEEVKADAPVKTETTVEEETAVAEAEIVEEVTEAAADTPVETPEAKAEEPEAKAEAAEEKKEGEGEDEKEETDKNKD
ncbi:MAG TPA: 50S ribosomal protein L17 [Flavobacteriales bacterium]|nr:50S ribosomal protein L17 [Flavobacteriales bacterium]